MNLAYNIDCLCIKYIFSFSILILQFLSIIVGILISVAFLVLLERKFMASVQRRRGPNVVGYGLLQSFADALKVFLKETIVSSYANPSLFLMAPIFSFSCSLALWLVIPFNSGFILRDFHVGILYIFAISSLSVYGILFAGWSSNSKYAFLGGLRSAAQMISYEIIIGCVFICIILFSKSMHLGYIVEFQKNIWFCIPLLILWIIFFITALAETNRSPFDLPEAEAELVAGYNVEYSAMSFVLFFLSEYANILFMSTLVSLLFLGGWYIPFFEFGSVFFLSLKLLFNLILFILVRAAYPRFRYDQLMRIGWKVLLPLTISLVYLEAAIILFMEYYSYI